VLIEFEVQRGGIEMLIGEGWLSPIDGRDPAAVARAIIALADRALASRVKPEQKSH